MTAAYAGPPKTVSCPCGFKRTSRTPGIADKALRSHSCETGATRRRRAEWRANLENTAGETVDCACKTVKHKHGTVQAYKIDGCKCRPCRNAIRAREADRNRQLAYGTWDSGRTDAAPVREHLAMLMANGVSDRSIAKASTVARSTLRKIIDGQNGRVLKVTAEKILSVQPGIDALGDGCQVDSTGTVRRLQALVAIGWPQSRIADQVGIGSGNFQTLLKSPTVRVRTAKKVSDLYDCLWDKTPAATSSFERAAITRARDAAAARGWLPPMAWDDDTIDDPTATPDMGEKVTRRDALGENVDYLARTGVARDEIAERLGYARWDTLERQLYRIGRSDLITLVKADTRTNAHQARIGNAA